MSLLSLNGVFLLFFLWIHVSKLEEEHFFVHPEPNHDFYDSTDDSEKFVALQHALIRNYNRHMRPAKDQRKPTLIDFFLYVSHIEELNENQQTLTLHGWITMSWRDENLDWSKATPAVPYWNISRFILPQYFIWKPDLHLYNNAELRDHVIVSWNTWVHIFQNGTVIFDPPFSMKATCDFDFHDYPWDTQNCTLQMGSWTYLSSQLKWRIVQGQSFNFLAPRKPLGANWQPLGIGNEIVFEFGTDYGRWHCVQVTLLLKRNPGYLPSLILMPIFVTCSMALCLFWVSNGRSLRIAVLCWVLLVEIVHFGMVAMRLPPGVFSKVPAVVRFCCFNIVMTMFCFIISLITNQLSIRETRKPPPSVLMQALEFGVLKHLCCFPPSSSSGSLYRHHQLMNSNSDQHLNCSELSSDEVGAQKKLLNKDWCLLACALDRICFILFSCVYAVAWFVYVF